MPKRGNVCLLLSHAFASSGKASLSGSLTGAGCASFSFDDSADSFNFMAPTNKPVKRPPLSRVLRKNSQVCGHPAVPLVCALIKPTRFFVYSALWNGLNSQEAVFVIR